MHIGLPADQILGLLKIEYIAPERLIRNQLVNSAVLTRRVDPGFLPANASICFPFM